MPQKLRLTFFSRRLPADAPSGYPRLVHWLAQGLVQRGHRVKVISLSPPPADARYAHAPAGLPRWAAGVGLFRRYLLGYYFYRQAARETADVFHFHGDNEWAARIHPQVRTFYGSARAEWAAARGLSQRLAQGISALLERRTQRIGEARVGIHESNRAHLPGLTHIIEPGLPEMYFDAARQKTPHPSLIFVGSLAGRKRGRELVSLFQRQILPRFPQARLTCVLPARESEARLGPGVEILTGLPDASLAAAYARSWMFVSLSRYEGFGLPYLEAMAAGMPAVVWDNAASRALVPGGGVGSAEAWSAAVLRLLADPAERARRAGEGRSRAAAYTAARMVESYETLYYHLTGI